MRKGSGVFGGESRLGEYSFSKTGRVSIVFECFESFVAGIGGRSGRPIESASRERQSWQGFR